MIGLGIAARSLDWGGALVVLGCLLAIAVYVWAAERLLRRGGDDA